MLAKLESTKASLKRAYIFYAYANKYQAKQDEGLTGARCGAPLRRLLRNALQILPGAACRISFQEARFRLPQ